MAANQSRSHRSQLLLIYFLSVILMIIRVDWWWWGKKIDPLFGGWLSIPMLYQLGIWIAGTGLVFWLCIGVWKQSDQGEDYDW
jgi:hypothetical protein